MLSLNAKAALAKHLDAVIITLAHGNEQAHLVEGACRSGREARKSEGGAKTETKLWQLVSAFFNEVNATTPHNDVPLFHSFVLLSLLLCCLSSSSQCLCFIFVLVCGRFFVESFRRNHDNGGDGKEKTNDDPLQESLEVC